MIETHHLLLHACFDDNICAWQTWQAQVNVDHLDRHSQWLLPLLFRRLSALQVAHPLLQRYKNVYLHNWYKNTMLLNALGAVVARLGSIPAVAKTDLGCVLDIYTDVGVRPLHRAEICVPADAWADLLPRLAPWQQQRQPHASAHEQTEQTTRQSLTIATNTHIPITITTDDTDLPPGWPRRVEPTIFRHHHFTRLDATDTAAYLLAARTRWNQHSDLLWWADVITFAQTRLRSITTKPLATEVLALANPFLQASS